jgi:hypothetical protein
MTGQPGKNFRAWGFGVLSVRINIGYGSAMKWLALQPILRMAVMIFVIAVLAACGRETPAFPTTPAEEQADYEQLYMLYNTRAVNTLGMQKEFVDHNRTVGRSITGRERSNNDLRLQMVGRRVLAAAYPICPREFRARSMMVGIVPKSQSRPVVQWAITPFGMADDETLRDGDIILGMGNEDIGAGLAATQRAQIILADYANRMEPLKFRIDRDGKILRVIQQPMKFCNYRLYMSRSNTFNAFADDKTITVYTGALKLLPTDDELAALIGHEVAHNVMRHIPKDRWILLIQYLGNIFANIGGGGVDDTVDVLTQRSFSRAHEYEADYVGVYISAMAGYQPEGALSLGQMLSMLDPSGNRSFDEWDDDGEWLLATHPDHAPRYTQLRRAVEQVKQRQAAGLPVMPDFVAP